MICPLSLIALIALAPPEPLPDVGESDAAPDIDAPDRSDDDAALDSDVGPARPDDDAAFDFNVEIEGVGPALTPAAPEVEAPPSNDGGAPPMPEVEMLPAREGDPLAPAIDPPPAKRPILTFDPAREPAGSNGGSFFDPGKLADSGPSSGIVQLRGFVGSAFLVTERTNTRQRTSDGSFERVAPLPFFGAGTATLYVGAAIWADAVYARISLEYLAIPRVTAGTEDVLAPARRELLAESAALEINPFAWAKRAPRWLREGFKVTAGVFIVPFGVEDENHAAPVNWFTTRPRSMTNGRVYPGTWSDVGAVVEFRPVFREQKPIRPLEIDIGLINGDPCTQTRWTDALYSPTGVVAACERVRRPDELGADMAGAIGVDPRADLGFLGVGPDNNQNKSLVARVSLYPLPDLQFGGSLIWGKHPRRLDFDDRLAGLSTIDAPQAPSWRAGAHVALDLDRVIASPYPLPMLRAEFIVGADHAPAPRPDEAQIFADRRVMGGYAQIAQPLYRRKRSALPGLMLQYRVDWANPDRDVPGVVSAAGVEAALRSDHADTYLYDETQLGHSVGLRWLVVPRFTVKADYTIIREDGGRANQLYNDRFVLQLVGDF